MSQRKSPSWIPGFSRAPTGYRAQVGWPDPRVDALFDTYLEWRDECEALDRAYEQLTSSERAERRLAYAAYRAALDREEKAAAVYEVAVTRLVGGERERTDCGIGGERWH